VTPPRELEFFETDRSLDDSFTLFQNHLESKFGKATSVGSGTEGFPDYRWQITTVMIEHIVREHFGPAERLRIFPNNGSLL
jgi:hypothetical protein